MESANKQEKPEPLATPTGSGIPRRTFLAGAVSALGLGLISLPRSAFGQIAPSIGSNSSLANLSIGYWNGTIFEDASLLFQGDPTLVMIAVNFEEFGSGALHSMDVLFPDPVNSQQVPYMAWTTGPSGCNTTQFVQNVKNLQALSISATVLVGKSSEAIPLIFVEGQTPGLKLLVGTYVITPQKMNWGAYGWLPDAANGPLVGAGDAASPPKVAQYVVMTVQRG